jgi:cytochrome P450
MAMPPLGPTDVQFDTIGYASGRPNIIESLRGLAQRHGDVVQFNLGRTPCVLVNGAPHVHNLFSEHEACLRKPEFVKDSNRGYWGDGLTTLEGAAWRSHRRMLLPSFSATSVEAYLPAVAECTKGMLDAWAPRSQADVLRQLRILIARIAARVVLDAEVEGYESTEGRSGVLPFSEAYGEDYASNPGGDSNALLIMVRPRAPRRMDATVSIIDERVASGEQRPDMLSALLLQRLPDNTTLTRSEILGEVMQLLYAGHLTMPHSLVNFWREIVAHDLVSRITSEADRLCADGVPEMAALSRSYCVAALKESMRLHPPAPILYREAKSAFELSGFELAKDVAVWVSPHLLHNDDRYFPESDRFIPERFMKGRLPINSRSVYMPFGIGQRKCIGHLFALYQMALIALLMTRRVMQTSMPM